MKNIQIYYVIEYNEPKSYIKSFQRDASWLALPEVTTTVINPFEAHRFTKEKAEEMVKYFTLFKEKHAKIFEIEVVSTLKDENGLSL